jgi:hypothetical protein
LRVGQRLLEFDGAVLAFSRGDRTLNGTARQPGFAGDGAARAVLLQDQAGDAAVRGQLDGEVRRFDDERKYGRGMVPIRFRNSRRERGPGDAQREQRQKNRDLLHHAHFPISGAGQILIRILRR